MAFPDDTSLTAPEQTYRFKATPARRAPTERDLARNRGVATLFNRITPGLPIDADPPETRQEPQVLGQMVEKIMQRLDLATCPWFHELTKAWPSLMPPEIAKVTIPGKVDAGILYIYVTHSIQLFEIRRTGLKHIEKTVRAFAGAEQIRHVRLMVNDVPPPLGNAASRQGV